MTVVADTHLHLYPCHDSRTALTALAANLSGMAPEATLAGFLAERYDCDAFADMQTGKVRVPGIRVTAAGEDAAILLRSGDTALYLFAGRQIVTAERIEILALATDERVGDGLPARETVARIVDTGGIPVVSWAPGKWFFGRGAVVRALIERSEPGRLLIGDSTLRPGIWPEPVLMRVARQKGLAVVAGSDPLPFAGEEQAMGSYASMVEGVFDQERPVTSVRAVLTNPAARIRSAGRRSGLFTMLRRLRRNAASRGP